MSEMLEQANAEFSPQQLSDDLAEDCQIYALGQAEQWFGREEAAVLRAIEWGHSLSRRHAKLTHEPLVTVRGEDLGSRNGAQLNGLPATFSTPMRPGDSLTVGASTPRLQISTPRARGPITQGGRGY